MSGNPRRQDLQFAATSRLGAAKRILENERGEQQLALYLNHVGIECLLKVRILANSRVSTLEELKKRMRESLVDELFSSKSGHNISRLTTDACLKRKLETTNNAHLLQRKAWKRLCNSARPYSLRYGQERPAYEDAVEEIQIADQIRQALQGD